MGAVRLGPPRDLINRLRRAFSISTFVEGGTYLGETAAWASEQFARVLTIERADELYRQAAARLGHRRHLQVIHGDTRDVLEQVLDDLPRPTMFWLDAHWSCGPTYGANDECPLLRELEIINRRGEDAFILIDDSRYFLAPPPPPHEAQQWPTLVDLLEALDPRRHGRFVAVVEDVLVAVPDHARPVVIEYCHDVHRRSELRTGRGSLRWVRSLLRR